MNFAFSDPDNYMTTITRLLDKIVMGTEQTFC